MTEIAAQLISFFFNPVLLLVFVPMILVYRTTGNVVLALAWTGYTMIFLLAMIFFLFYGVQKKLFTDMDVSKRTQRPLLFAVSFIMGLVYLAGLFLFHGPKILITVVIGIIASVILITFINMKLKMSIHVATISALLFSFALINQGYYYFSLLLIPLVAWARLRIKRHTLPETIVGAIFGILLSLVMFYIVGHWLV